jgi:hypothetical protein
MLPMLDEARLRGFADAPEPIVFARIARDWVNALPEAAARVRGAAPPDRPRELHELRSGAVAVGLPRLASVLAGIEQRAETGTPPAAGEIEAALALAEDAADALDAWWERTGIRG